METILNSLKIKTTYSETLFNGVYSINLKAKNLPFFSNGKGENLKTAKLSALGEMCERLLTRNYFEDYFLDDIYPGSKVTNFLDEKLKKFYNIENLQKEDLIDFSSSKDEILSIPFIEYSTNKVIYFPINLIQNLYASNGMAFYTDKKTAFDNAMSEIIERYVKFEVIKNGYSLPKISHKYNSKNIQVYDASLNKFPVMAVSFIKGKKILLAFGCDLDQEKAIKKAYFELMQGRDNFDDIGEFSDSLEEVKDSYNLESHFISNIGLIDTNFLSPSKFKPIKWEFKDYFVFDKEIYYKEFEFNQNYAYQIIIPSISEIYPIDDLIYNNKNQGKFYRDLVLNYQNFNKLEIIDYLEELNPYLDLGKFIGVIFKTPILVIDFINMLNKNKIDLTFDESYLEMKRIIKRLK